MDRCQLCPNLKPPVQPDGPVQSKIMVIGNSPKPINAMRDSLMGYQETMEFNENYLMLAGLHRSEIRFSNVTMCGVGQGKKPSDELNQCCSEFHLRDEVWECAPEVVMLLGAVACELVGGIDLEAQHGIPFKGMVMDWPCWVIAIYHPSAGLTRTSLMIDMLEDWERLKPWLESLDEENCEWQWSVDAFVGSKRDYRLARTRREVREYFNDYHESFDLMPFIGGDTESHAGVPFSLQISMKVGTGLMVLLTDKEAISELNDGLAAIFLHTKVQLVLHNAESDIDLFEQLIHRNCQINYIDTMAMAYQLQNLPQKLKALSYRLLGRKRQSWQQLVGGASRDKLTDWLWLARDIVNEEFTISEPRISEKTGRAIKPKIIKSPLEGFFNRLITQINKKQDDDSPYDPWKRLKEFEYSVSDLVIMSRLSERLGDYPKLGIANCDLAVARDYGCSDADDTLALAGELRRLKRGAEAGWGVVESDWDRQHEVEVVQPL